jgi:hypothetical protein
MYQLLHEIEQGQSGEAQAEIVSHELVIRQSAATPRG